MDRGTMTAVISQEERIKGCVFGQAIGDALGLGTEFMSEREVRTYYPHGLKDYQQIIQDAHRSRWAKGSWTDDTDMMLCISDAIVEDRGTVDYNHVARNFKQWFNDKPMGIGRNTFKVLSLYDYLVDPMMASSLVWQSGRCQSAANGALMRTSIIGILGDPQKDAENICRLTHTDPRCVGSCVIVSSIIHGLVHGSGKIPDIEEICLLGDSFSPKIRNSLYFETRQSSEPSFKYDLRQLNLSGKEDMGYTLKALSASIWALYHAKSFEEGLWKTVNAGGDADTNAAIACSILGAKFGFNSIPTQYVDGLTGRLRLESLYNNILNILQ